jgi:putative phosphoribosyl transferase
MQEHAAHHHRELMRHDMSRTRRGNMPATEQMHEVLIPDGALKLPGTLGLPDTAIGTIIFAHGSGSSRHSRRNQMVAAELRAAGLATLLFDLLTEREAADRGNVFDIELLAARLGAATVWTRASHLVSGLPIGYFGASTGAAAAVVAAAEDKGVAAVVSRGGRPDLGGDLLDGVRAPTLLIVGSADYGVVELNEQAYERLTCRKRLAIVPEATHLFEEPGALEHVAALAREWFVEYLSQRGRA